MTDPFAFDPARVEAVDHGPAPEEGKRNFGFVYRAAWGTLDLECFVRCSRKSYAQAVARGFQMGKQAAQHIINDVYGRWSLLPVLSALSEISARVATMKLEG